jgi:prepilin-type processing-associated H-X9-DG protein
MKSKVSYTRKDLIVTLVCVVFLLASLGAIGKTGRRRAKELLCLSNLGRWGQVFLDYAADNDGYFMRGWFSGGGIPGPYHTDYWMEALRPYYGNPDLRCCPEATKTQMNADGTAGPGAGGGTFSAWGVFPGECGKASYWWGAVTACDYGSYGMNAWVCNPPSASENNWRTADVAGGQDIPVLIGAQWIDAWPDATDPVPQWDGEPWGPFSDYGFMMRVCMNRHDGFVNSAFLDGSARKVPLKCLWKLKWHRTFDPEEGPTEEEFNSTGDGWMAEFPPCE